MKNIQGHIIKNIKTGSIAQELELEAGDRLISINNEPVEDVFDYQFMIQDEYLELLIKKADGEEWLLEVEKDSYEDLGIEFENGLMDDYRHCSNKCIFCFIDQMPPGMRDTLYFKDDDARLSFLQGNYVTLTNMSDADVKRICKYHLSPINISVQTMNPELRCMMLHNRFAGSALSKIQIFKDHGIEMNGQIVLCKGVNDGDELKFSLKELEKYCPELRSVSVVPVGLSKYRDGLYPLVPFTKEDAVKVISIIEDASKEAFKKYGIHLFHASDEWYLLADMPLPEADRYDGYIQYENGVGMLRMLLDEFHDALNKKIYELGDENKLNSSDGAANARQKDFTIVTGRLAYPVIKQMCEEAKAVFPNINPIVKAIRNDFFGELITVSGLLTGQDIISQLKDEYKGDYILLPENVLRSGEEVFLDDYHLHDVSLTLQVPIHIVKSRGYDFLEALLRSY